MVVLHGYAMRPSTYTGLVRVLAERCTVYVPDLFAVRGRWRAADVVAGLSEALDEFGVERATFVGHSFGGGIELAFAAGAPERVVELVFSDTLAASSEWGLAREALRHPARLVQLATPLAITSFARSWARYPHQLASAAWWAFTSGRDADSASVAAAGVPAHVLWANRDSILSRSDGRRFAAELDATFTVARDDQVLDHDWMFQQPSIFVEHLERLGLHALTA